MSGDQHNRITVQIEGQLYAMTESEYEDYWHEIGAGNWVLGMKLTGMNAGEQCRIEVKLLAGAPLPPFRPIPVAYE